MRIATAAALALACGQPPAPDPGPPSCARAWDAIATSLHELHVHAGRPVPTLPDRAAWIGTCEGLALSPEALRCLEPAVAAADHASCATALRGVDRAPLDQPFLDTMLAPGGAP